MLGSDFQESGLNTLSDLSESPGLAGLTVSSGTGGHCMESSRSPIKRQPAQSDGMPVKSDEFLDLSGVCGANPGDAHIMLGAGEGHGDGESKPEGQGLGNAVLMQSSSRSQIPRVLPALPVGVAGLIHSSGSNLVEDLGIGLINMSGRRGFIANGDAMEEGAMVREAMSEEPCS